MLSKDNESRYHRTWIIQIYNFMNIKHHFLSPNYDSRLNNIIDMIILHYTEMTFSDACQKLCDPLSKVSAHYLIAKDGAIYQLVDDTMRAWHAGQSYWQGREALNNSSIGIEIDNLGNEQFTISQMSSCAELCKALMNKYNIAPDKVLGHSDIAPNRKIDPGLYFDWAYLAKHNIGIQYNKEDINHSKDYTCENVQTKLRKLGYQIEVTGLWDSQTQHVIRAFQSHFCQKSLLSHGPDFYLNMNIEYHWDQESNDILDLLVNM